MSKDNQANTDTDTTLRLDKYVSKTTGLSRKQSHIAIRKSRVTVNGELVRQSAQLVNIRDTVTLDDEVIEPPLHRYFLFHKPEGLVCANKDNRNPTVIDEFYDEPRYEDLQCVGRLDIDTTGLLLVTDDGQWNHRITHPNYHCTKSYYVDFEGELPKNASDKFAEGIFLADDKKRTEPATFDQLSEHEINLHIQEGRYHQVKRMMHAIGCEVLQLHRYQIGGLVLDEDMPPGTYRRLTDEEVALF